MGCGSWGPDYESGTLITPEGFQVPAGEMHKSPEPTNAQLDKALKECGETLMPDRNLVNRFNFNRQPASNYQLQSNEFIVYNVDQVRIRYML